MTIHAGKLRRRITIQEVTEAQNDYGEPIKTWNAFARRWASVEPLQGREFFDAKQVIAEASIRFRLRYLTGVTTKMRILFDSRTFNIESIINPNERNRELQLMCVETV